MIFLKLVLNKVYLVEKEKGEKDDEGIAKKYEQNGESRYKYRANCIFGRSIIQSWARLYKHVIITVTMTYVLKEYVQYFGHI